MKLSIEQMGDEEIEKELSELIAQLAQGSGLPQNIKMQMQNRINALVQRQEDIREKSSNWRRQQQQQQASERGRDGHGHGELQGQDIVHLIHASSSQQPAQSQASTYNPFSNSNNSKAKPVKHQREQRHEPLQQRLEQRQHKFEPYAALAALSTHTLRESSTSQGWGSACTHMNPQSQTRSTSPCGFTSEGRTR